MKHLKSASLRATSLAALLISAVASGCGSGNSILGADVATAASTIAVTPAGAIAPGASCSAASGPTIPTVTQSTPVNGDQLVPVSTSGAANNGKSIAATFSLAMNPTTINTTSFTLTPAGGAVVTGAVSLNPSATVATLTTTAPLVPATSYAAVITKAATSASGTPLGCVYAWTFKTAAAAAAGPPPITLGLATPFAIASAGGITNSGATKINGDTVLDPNQTCNAVPVGSGNNFGSCPANPPTNNAGDRVITQIFPDTTTADAVIADLKTTFNGLSPASTPGGTALGCGTIGTGGGAGALVGCSGNATLPPGTYISATSSTIGVAGDLTLDAAGNANAVWVFQAPSALNTAANTRILLINGAKASNVWWYVGSSATLVTSTLFQGNVLSSASINLGTGVTSCGRLLSGAGGAGSLTMLANTISVPGSANAPAGCI